MIRIVLTMAGLLLLGTSLSARADADDKKWIAQCVKDNKHEGAKPEVVQKYCTCMNEKMDDNETRSVTEWEKVHPNEEKECSKQAGWK